MHTQEVNSTELRLLQNLLGVHLREVPDIDAPPACLFNLRRGTVAGILMKLNIWNLTEWDR
eukprot:5490839-Amphidinium_carterae.1